jgi:glycosyltransferase involved in cell wall biosynthesis
MRPKEKIKVLMIVGVYYPEINGAVLQCKQLIRTMSDSIAFSVLTGTNNRSNVGSEYVEDVLVTRVLMPKYQKLEYIFGFLRFFLYLINMLMKTDLVHVHGFSKRNAIVIAISRICNKKVILKMTSFGQDDPLSVRKSSFFFWQLFKCCHAYIGLSSAFFSSFQKAGLPESKYYFIPNCVDLKKFLSLSTVEKNKLKYEYGFLETDRIVLFVGHFSPEKRPMLAYEAWLFLHEKNPNVKIIFIGHTRRFFEVDDEIIEIIRNDAINRGVLPSIHFVENTFHVDEYMKIADVFVLPSIREGLPNVLLEAMACALPCFVNNLPGVTDWLIDDGKSGVLLYSDTPSDWAEKIMPYFTESARQKISAEARCFVENNFSCSSTSLAVKDLYEKYYDS